MTDNMLDYLIPLICLSFNPQYQQACSYTLTATSIQTQFKQNLDKTQEIIQKKVTDITGKKVWEYTMTIYQINSQQKILYTTSFKPISDTLSIELSTNNQGITLTWIW